MTQYETTEAQENGICGKENGGGRGIDGFWLKMLAVVTMLIDHIGAIFFPGVLWIRAIGRLSFPSYAFLLTEGFHHTRSTDSYLKRLVLFACISEPFFDLAFYGELIHPAHQNIFFTLALSLFMLDKCRDEKAYWKNMGWLLGVMITAELLHVDYGCGGVLVVLLFERLRERKKLMAAAVSLLFIFLWGGVQSFAALALLPILLYNGERGRKIKYVFYTFYPVHLAILWLLKLILVQMYGFQG